MHCTLAWLYSEWTEQTGRRTSVCARVSNPVASNRCDEARVRITYGLPEVVPYWLFSSKFLASTTLFFNMSSYMIAYEGTHLTLTTSISLLSSPLTPVGSSVSSSEVLSRFGGFMSSFIKLIVNFLKANRRKQTHGTWTRWCQLTLIL